MTPRILTDAGTGGLAVALFLLLFATANTVAAGPVPCPGSPVLVDGADTRDQESVCAGAAGAFAFLARHGMEVEGTVTINVVDRLETLHTFGQYNPETGRVALLSYGVCAEMTANAPIFRQAPPLSRALYQSFVAHEVAHLVAQGLFEMDGPYVAAQEYIAYTTQLGAMEPALRERILARYDQPAFLEETEINEVFLLLDPEVFAVKAYRHFVAPGNGAAFYRKLLVKGVPGTWSVWR